ncbi:kinase-like domain-containing protein [Polychytrium aggregatum]|uniref:kinase-like domain-containing protein n=1 Tax=Polychytrium aggregatum TaxID=110093 RepID=UPI0022FF4160|nr:kinase-like domain-containing protein [Polychytrium aggregatum]KAI9205716.1 kinase-like domain-containing protein [Polychytrium aggregatum]
MHLHREPRIVRKALLSLARLAETRRASSTAVVDGRPSSGGRESEHISLDLNPLGYTIADFRPIPGTHQHRSNHGYEAEAHVASVSSARGIQAMHDWKVVMDDKPLAQAIRKSIVYILQQIIRDKFGDRSRILSTVRMMRLYTQGQTLGPIEVPEIVAGRETVRIISAEKVLELKLNATVQELRVLAREVSEDEEEVEPDRNAILLINGDHARYQKFKHAVEDALFRHIIPQVARKLLSIIAEFVDQVAHGFREDLAQCLETVIDELRSPKELAFKYLYEHESLFFKELSEARLAILVEQIKAEPVKFEILTTRKLDPDLDRRVEREVSIIAQLRSPFVSQLLCYFCDDLNYYKVTEHCEMSVRQVLKMQPDGIFSEMDARFYAAEILVALEYLHDTMASGSGVVLGNLRTDTVMVYKDGHIRLNNFDQAAPEGTVLLPPYPVHGYLSPEAILEQVIKKSMDWWAYGILIYEMVCGEVPFGRCDHMESYLDQIRLRYRSLLPKSYLKVYTNDLLARLLVPKLGERLGSWHGATDIKCHPWFNRAKAKDQILVGIGPWVKVPDFILKPPYSPYVSMSLLAVPKTEIFKDYTSMFSLASADKIHRDAEAKRMRRVDSKHWEEPQRLAVADRFATIDGSSDDDG